MVHGRWFQTNEDLLVPLSIRQSVFGRGLDATDAQARQVVVYSSDVPVGTARLWWQDGAFWLGDVAVTEEQRGKGYGDLLVRLLLFKALTHSAGEVRLMTPKATQAFFARYGFVADEADGDLIPMHIKGEDIHLSHCGGNCDGCPNQTEACIPKALR